MEGAGRCSSSTPATRSSLDVAARHETAGCTPLFVLHGFPTCSFDWRSVLPALGADRRVVLFDFFGFGLSAKPDVRYSIRRYADQAERGRATRWVSSGVVLVTHDMGDTVGGELLARDLDGESRLRDRTRGCSRTAASTSRWRTSRPGSSSCSGARRRARRHRRRRATIPASRFKAGLAGDVLGRAPTLRPRSSTRSGSSRAQRRQHAAAAHDPVHRGSPCGAGPLHRRDRATSVAARRRVGRARSGRGRCR